MSAIFVEKVKIPKTVTCAKRQFVSFNSEINTKLGDMFFVVGRTNTGGRYYSDSTDDFDIIFKIFLDYCDVVSYFGGGTVELFAISKDGYNIVERAII